MTVTPIDLAPYVELTLFDRQPGSLVERAVADAVAKLPGWVPREGLTELVLIEANALITAELVYAINRVPGAVAEGVIRLFNVERDQGAPASMTVEFTFVDDVGRTVPAGARLRLDVDGTGWLFVTTTDAVAAPGDTTATATAVAAKLGADPNGTIAGTAVDLLDLHYYVDDVAVSVAPAGGRDLESSAAYLVRASARLSRLTETLQLAGHFVAAALENPLVKRARVVGLYDPDGAGEPGDNPGHTTLAVMGAHGVALTGGERTALHDALRPLTADHLVLHVVDADLTAVAVHVAVERLATFTDDEVETNVTTTLQGYLDADAWPWGTTVWRNELISVVDQAAGVSRVVLLTTPAADVVLDGVAPLATAGAITVDVT